MFRLMLTHHLVVCGMLLWEKTSLLMSASRSNIFLFKCVQASVQEKCLLLMFYGSFGILIWKCGSQLEKETVYKPVGEDLISKLKTSKEKGSKYSKILY